MTTVRTSRRLLITTVGLAILVASPTAGAQQPPDRLPRLGVLAGQHWSLVEAFREGLRDLGWVEGRNLLIVFRLMQGQDELLPSLAAELVGLGVDVLLAPSPTYLEPARQATRTIPIVFCTHYGPVEAGHVASLARPGGNLTGLTSPGPELTAKRLALLKEAVPGARRIAVLTAPTWGAPPVVEPVEAAAHALGVELRRIPVRNVDELDEAFAAMASAGVDALLAPPSEFTFFHSAHLAELALRYRLPGMFGVRESAEAGGLMSYAADFRDQFRRCAGYVDRILKGASPAELPVEQASKYELVVNLKTARELDLKLSPSILARADEVIQ